MANPDVPFPLFYKHPKTEEVCRDCPFPMNEGGHEMTFPLPIGKVPTTVKDLIGMFCRVIGAEQSIELDWHPNRASFVVDSRGVIVDIRIG